MLRMFARRAITRIVEPLDAIEHIGLENRRGSLAGNEHSAEPPQRLSIL